MPSGLAISVTTDSVVSVDMGASEPAGGTGLGVYGPRAGRRETRKG